MSQPRRVGDLSVLDQANPLDGALNMALDEVILEHSQDPVLRFYQWDGDWISFGFFKSFEEVRSSYGSADLSYVRRRTGGGIVDHRADLTYSLLVPKSHPLAQERGPGSYDYIHQVLAESLEAAGVSVVRQLDLADNGNARCFENPVQYDLQSANGQKIAGAGQHRGKFGLIHQGSIQHCQPQSRWKSEFAQRVAERPQGFELPNAWLEQAKILAAKRYRTETWTQRR